MGTNIASGAPQTGAIVGAALFAQAQKTTGTFRNLVGDTPPMSEIEGKLGKQQSSSAMPIVEVKDLTKAASDTVRVDCVDVVVTEPIMGSRNAEGKGAPMSFSSFDTKVDQYTFPVSAGNNMSQQRTPHNLRRLARAQAVGLMSKYFELTSLVHLAGSRGQATGGDWGIIPAQTADNFAEVMVNPVKAPTYNRHFVVSGSNIVQGGAQLASIASTDALKLSHLDQLRNVIDNLDLSLQSVKVADDPAANDEPMWVMYVPSNVYSSLLQEGSLRAFQQHAINRASFGSKHPLFRGECGMWNGILVKKLPRAIRFGAGTTTKHVTAANAALATETDVTINAGLTAGYAVERCILLGAQALTQAYGNNNNSGTPYTWAEKLHNFERDPEFAVFGVGGQAKVRFDVKDATGTKIATDHGVIVLDVAAKQSV